MLPKAIKNLRSAVTVCTATAAFFALPANAGDNSVLAAGPVDSANCAGKFLSVLGINFRAVDRGGAAAICALQGRSHLSYVSVTGRLNPSGVVELVSSRVLSLDGYVPGSTAVYLKGSVTETDSLTGKAIVNGAVVNTTERTPQVGNTIEVVGTQPLVGGTILPAHLSIADGADVLSSTGSGFESSSSTGSGVAAFSSTGSGKASLSSTGSGASKLSSTGSEAAKLSSTGSGTAKLSSTGSGVAALSSTGSGASKLSSTGSGAAKLSSTGSGAATLSSTGSGVSALSSTGSGVSKLSSTGSGAAKLSSAGSGSAVLSSIGSGVTKLSSTGSGVAALSSTGSGIN